MKICLECEGITDAAQEDCTSCGIRMSETTAVHFPLRRGEQDAGNPLLGMVVDGKYLIQGVLGKGGMGTVFRATHQVSLVPVALKILNARFSVHGEYRDYFLAEAQKAGRVVHEHAGRILDVGEAEDGTVYIAMEEVRGVTLHECLHGELPVAPATVVDILAQITQALMAAHEAGLVHRDLTPRNVMVMIRGGEPFVKILDFGIAKGLPHSALPDAGVSTEPAVFANPPYSAPEHLEGKDVDDRGDLYSLGVIAYEALSQTLPVRTGSVKEMAAATIRGDLVPMPARPDVPARLVQLIRSLLARDPDRRPGSAAEVLATLNLIRQPGSRVVRDSAVLLFVVAIVVLVLSFFLGAEAPPTLTKRSLGGFAVVSPTATPPAVVHYQSYQLREMTFDFDGFRASELVVEIDSPERKAEVPLPLPGTVTADGKLLLDSRTNIDYRQLLGRLAKEAAPTLLVFYARNRALGKARFVVDDTPPELSLRITDGDNNVIESGGIVNQRSLIQIGYLDTSAPGGLELTCIVDGVSYPIDVKHRYQEKGLRCSDLLAELQKASAAPLRAVRLRLTGKDTAGNLASNPVVRDFETVDFLVPAVRSAGELRALEDRSQGKARLSLEFEGPDDGLAVWVRGRLCVMETSADGKVNIELKGADIGGLVSGDSYDFKVRDRAGNLREFTSRLTFYRHAPEVRLRTSVVADVLHTLGEDLLIWSGEPGSLPFTCNSFYKPSRVRLLRDGSVDTGDALKLSGSQHGGGVLHLPDADAGLPDGQYKLVVDLVPDDPEAKPRMHSWNLRKLGQGLQLRIPDATGIRFFRELVGDRGLLRLAEGSLIPGAGWQLTPVGDPRLIRGEVYWSGRPTGDFQELKLTVADSANAALIPFRPRALLHPGRNTLCIHLRDVFGRPVQVLLGGAKAPLAKGLPKGTSRMVDFQYQMQDVTVPRDPMLLEYRRPTTVVLRTPYDFARHDLPGIELTLKAANPLPRQIKCSHLAPIDGGGTQLSFVVDYPTMADIVGRDREDQELRRGNLEMDVQVGLGSPAFEPVSFASKIKNVRSSLPAGQLSRWFDDLGDALAVIGMVPVLRPIEDTFPDPVSELVRRKGSFVRKQPIEVGNLRDFYLQSAELTRGQYAYIVRKFADVVAKDGPVDVHMPGDPKGVERWKAANLVPMTLTPKTWSAAVNSDPDAPVTGVNFYQAFAIARMAGQVVAGNPATFRLPFAVELELAALTGVPAGSLNGLRGKNQLEAVRVDGGSVGTSLSLLRGVDFGVREWVLDLPWPTEPGARQIVAGILKDHEDHRAQALGLGDQPNLSAGQKFELRRIGVVRGRNLADGRPVTDLLAGGRVVQNGDMLPIGVPGVVKTLYLARTGTGLLGRPHRLLGEVGLRLAGGAEFLKRVRMK
ncbi:MAG: bifunctional serine/threonine-protein kinase/formylglycine-generating enzyme family protein [Planctomycetota bacterium]|nr:bifunctional serine/threonine-protein kinase/formylglycine-generating enzyme family protein [Planctomycetota bacterium]